MIVRQYLRRSIQAAIVIILLFGINYPWLRYLLRGSISWICPFFYLQVLSYSLREFAVWIPLMAFILGGVILISLIFGRAFCGWICPFGALLDGFGALKDPRTKRALPEWAADRSIKYGMLLGFLLSASILVRPVFCDVCPFGGLYRGVSAIWMYPTIFIFIPLLILLLVFLVAVFFDTRAWCKYWCPLGAFISIFNPISLKRFRVNLPASKCIECLKCNKDCIMDVRPMESVIYKHRETIDTVECIRCFACRDGCPMVPRTPLKLSEIAPADKVRA